MAYLCNGCTDEPAVVEFEEWKDLGEFVHQTVGEVEALFLGDLREGIFEERDGRRQVGNKARRLQAEVHAARVGKMVGGGDDGEEFAVHLNAGARMTRTAD